MRAGDCMTIAAVYGWSASGRGVPLPFLYLFCGVGSIVFTLFAVSVGAFYQYLTAYSFRAMAPEGCNPQKRGHLGKSVDTPAALRDGHAPAHRQRPAGCSFFQRVSLFGILVWTRSGADHRTSAARAASRSFQEETVAELTS